MVIPVTLVLFCLVVVEDIQVKGYLRFLNPIHLYKNKEKKSVLPQFAFDGPTVWNDLPDEARSAQFLPVLEKRLKSGLSWLSQLSIYSIWRLWRIILGNGYGMLIF